MKHARFTLVETDHAPASGQTAEAQSGMADIVAGLDSRFIPAGETLARLVEAMGAVLSGIDTMGQVLGEDSGEDSGAAQALLSAAHQLREAPARQAERAQQVAALCRVMQQLGTHSAEIARILTVLEFYTVNLKIAAAGADEFVEFANDMSVKLKSGSREVEAFNNQIKVMQSSLADMRRVDDVLARECARVIPQVPDRLVAEVDQLRSRQMWLAQVAAFSRDIILRLQGRVGVALGAMQIGDITRQRLEHVLDGCRALEHALADPQGADKDGTRGHMLRLYGDQLADLTGDFIDQTGDLLDVLGSLGPDCAQLLNQTHRDATMQQSGHFLRNLGECIAGAQGMTGQLQRANEKAVEIADVVVQVVHALRQRVQTIESLRFDVDYMAINVNIRARRDAQIGRPVAVIADEIRICSQQLAELILSIAKVADDLGLQSEAFENGHDGGAQMGVDTMLTNALAIIRQGAGQSEEALGEVDRRAQGIAGMIDVACDELSICGTLSENLRAMTDSFAVLAGTDQPDTNAASPHPAATLMEDIARRYTMSSERRVHDRHLLPGMAPLTGASTGHAGGPGAIYPPPDDDDALFDDALF
ncbi:chemotaxis protein [Novosphingobium sp. KACC 22771]|uniref:chemotaxis protein n=1 Tax=Novosphingobium sp. KACC 22771 TaxID=3025670 RepID=UPI0023668F4E|nr:chemotaxis protein [Novosphingobium sp. KACC 22771]WDF71726.1 chemotaxis protein [Novosphingobium sp. KACC 22771]